VPLCLKRQCDRALTDLPAAGRDGLAELHALEAPRAFAQRLEQFRPSARLF
jgi:hypothetical protein